MRTLLALVLALVASSAQAEDPVLSPDGRLRAEIVEEGPRVDEITGPPTSLWVTDTATGERRRLFASRPAEAPERDMKAFFGPLFSPDGMVIYVSAYAWATSAALHAVTVATGEERFVTSGSARAVIRNGPYKGWLLVDKHEYYPAPTYGSYEALYAVRPDGKRKVRVPNDDAEAWLKKKGWTAD